MEVYETLNNNFLDILPEDLDLLETELNTGNYSQDYINTCKRMISEMRTKFALEDKKPKQESNFSFAIVDDSVFGSQLSTKTFLETVKDRIHSCNASALPEKSFEEYIKSEEKIDAKFVDTNFKIFNDWQIKILLNNRQMGEEFLEKYFDALDKSCIAKTQEFSESFYMKHFSDLPAVTVLEHGKNPWRKKDKRSKQLNVFLRLKGVKI